MNFSEFHFIRPYWLLALLPWLLLIVLTVKHKLSQGNWSSVCDEPLLPFILQQTAVNRSRLPIILTALAGLLAIVALAGPTWERLPSPVFRNDSALVIALDLSRSMDAPDIKPSRLVRARYKIADILNRRKDGQTALLVYASDAFTVTPLTDDNVTIESQLSALTTDIMPSQGSDAANALEQAVDLLKQAGMQKGHILLVTDGVDFEKTESVVKSLDHYYLSILGVGTASGAPIRANEGGFLKDRKGNIVVPKLNIEELSELAGMGRGVYQTISPNDNDITTLLSFFDSGVHEEGKDKSQVMLEHWSEKGPWFLLAVLPLAALSFRKGILSIALLLMLPFPKSSHALSWDDLWQTPNQQAQQAFQRGQFDKAAEEFDNPEWKAAAQYKAKQYDRVLETLKNINSADSLYNQGNALAQAGRLQEAIAAYNKALSVQPHHADAKFNKELIEKELKKQQQEQQQQQKGENQQSSPQSQQYENGESSENSGDRNEPTSDNSESRHSAEQSSSAEKKPGRDSEPQKDIEKGEKAQQAQDQGNEKTKEDTVQSAQSAEKKSQDEAEQANEQWLKRIPDDPAGLLKRKFLYQYGQRDRKTQYEEAW